MVSRLVSSLVNHCPCPAFWVTNRIRELYIQESAKPNRRDTFVTESEMYLSGYVKDLEKGLMAVYV
jgi:hypothetical protein